MSEVAYEPKSGYEDPDALGTVFVNDTTEVNVREKLKDGGGVLITDDPLIIAALDRYEPLKRISVSRAEEKQASDATATDTGTDTTPDTEKSGITTTVGSKSGKAKS